MSSTMGRLMMLMVLVAAVLQLTSSEAANMVVNPSFEEEDVSAWSGKMMKGDPVRSNEEAYHGDFSLFIANRNANNSGAAYVLDGVEPGRGYELSAYVKFDKAVPGRLYQRFKAVVNFDLIIDDEKKRDPVGHDGNYVIAYRAFATPDQGWIHLTGNINAPVMPYKSATLSIQGPDPEVNFYLDQVTLSVVPERPDWLADSHAMIEENRKSGISFSVDVPESIKDPSEFDVQVRLKKHLFAFGSKFEEKIFRRKKLEKYADFMLSLFSWATVPNFSWNLDKGTDLFKPNYSNTMKAVDRLLERGLKLRATSVIRTVEKNVPDRVIDYPTDKLESLLKFRAEYIVGLTKGKVEIWDVINEYLHGKYYEERLQDPHITEKVFKWATAMDPTAKFAINDFTAVNSGASTEDFHDVAKRFIDAGTGINALGIQGHVKAYVQPDPNMIWKRLDRLQDTGLELYLTEFDVGWYDDITRGDWLEDALRAYYAHPAMYGVTLWGIWDQLQRYSNQYLIYGPDMKFVEPGERFVCLLQKEWTTDKSFNLPDANNFRLKGFQGEYEVIVKKNGVPVQLETFTLGKEDKVVALKVTEKSDPVDVKERTDFVPKCVSHRDRKSLGKVTSTSTSSTLTCDIASGESSVTCPAGKVMTTCGSFQDVGGSLQWTGEKITWDNGQATCNAAKSSNFPQTGGTVYARCCEGKGFTCDYRQAGPSSPFDGAMAEATCPTGHIAMGCTASNQNSELKGAFTNGDMTSCLAQTGASLSEDPRLLTGVVSAAACCSRPEGLQCRQEKGSASFTCPGSDVMVGCTVEAENGSKAGAHIVMDENGIASCEVVGNGEAKVQAVAMCCIP